MLDTIREREEVERQTEGGGAIQHGRKNGKQVEAERKERGRRTRQEGKGREADRRRIKNRRGKKRRLE